METGDSQTVKIILIMQPQSKIKGAGINRITPKLHPACKAIISAVILSVIQPDTIIATQSRISRRNFTNYYSYFAITEQLAAIQLKFLNLARPA